ncbi:MAG TPA: hypothetical protein PKM25_01715 [Candidatus Ozemobacteraceae bacterium]|nr:hypothetical protein [Candidatus Ozemobacteraceae bacterium]
MIVMNAGVLPGVALPSVYGVSLAVCGIIAWLLRDHLPRFDRAVAGRGFWRLLIPLLIITFTLLLAPRAVYLAEPSLGYCIDTVCWDDEWHIQEITALIDTPSFPVRSPIEPERWLSFYYAPWMLPAAVWHLLPGAFKTVKIALFIGWTITGGLALAFLVVAASRVAASSAAFAMLVYFIFWQSGARSLFAIAAPMASHEWWMARVGSTLGFGTVASGTIWTVHHLVSATAVLLAFLIAESFLASAGDRARHSSAGSWAIAAGCGVLMASSILGSTFVVLGGIPLLGWWLVRHGGAGVKLAARVAIVAAALVLPVLWLFLGREISMRVAWGGVFPAAGMNEDGSHIYYIVSYILLAAADIGMPAFAIFLAGAPQTTAMGGRDTGTGAGSIVPWAAAALTIPFFIVYSGTSNNLALRGTLLPVLTLMPWAASRWAPHLRRPPVFLLAVVLALGSASEIAACWSRAVQSLKPEPSTLAIRTRLLYLNLGWLRSNEELSPGVPRVPISSIGASCRETTSGGAIPRNSAAIAAVNAFFGDTASLSARLAAGPKKRLRYLAERRLPPGVASDGRLLPVPLAALEIANEGPFGPWSWQRRQD